MKPKTNISPQCSICEIGRPSPDGKTMLCVKKGVVPNEYICTDFEYDPLKRVPKLPDLQKFDKSDFEI